LLKYADGKVSLRKSDGQVITIPLANLSATDREFVRRQANQPDTRP